MVGACVTHVGEIRHQPTREAIEGPAPEPEPEPEAQPEQPEPQPERDPELPFDQETD